VKTWANQNASTPTTDALQGKVLEGLCSSAEGSGYLPRIVFKFRSEMVQLEVLNHVNLKNLAHF